MDPRPQVEELKSEAARLAYSIQRAEAEGDGESAGAYTLRGAFQALRYALGEAEEPVPPSITAGEDDDPVSESEFVEAIAQYAAAFSGTEAPEAQVPRDGPTADGGDSPA